MHKCLFPEKERLLQAIILNSDGTLTSMLELIFEEPIEVTVLSNDMTFEKVETSSFRHPEELEKIIKRHILLTGKKTRTHYLAAESIIFFDNLDEIIQKELLETSTPIGKIWESNKVEIFKNFINRSIKTFPERYKLYFPHILENEKAITRSFEVITNKKRVAYITEYIPFSYFSDKSRSLMKISRVPQVALE